MIISFVLDRGFSKAMISCTKTEAALPILQHDLRLWRSRIGGLSWLFSACAKPRSVDRSRVTTLIIF
jgi:hypothetical protein